MGKIIQIAIASFFIVSAAQAQIQKGSLLLGGGIGVTTNKTEEANTERKSNYISLTPTIGIAVQKNTIIGLQAIYGHSKDDLTSPSTESKFNGYGGDLFVRKYLPLGKAFYLFGQSGLYYRRSNHTYSSGPSVNKQKGWSIGINLYPGVSYAVTNKFHLETALTQLANLEYSKTKNIGSTTQERSGINFSANLSSLSNFTIGFRIFLSK